MKHEIQPFAENGKIELLIVHHRHEYYREQLETLSDRFQITSIDHRQEIPFDSHPAQILLCWQFPDDLLNRLPHLKWIAALSAGVDHILAHKEKLSDVLVTRAKGTMGAFLAEYSLQHALNHIRNYHTVQEQENDNNWRFVKSDLLSRQQVTIYGMGSLGSDVGKAFHVLGARVVGVKRNISQADRERLAWCEKLYSFDDLRKPVPETDVHILLMPDVHDTRHLFNMHLFNLMKPTSLLINIGRGALISDPDLLEALDAGKLSKAVLDVFGEEPLRPGHPFWDHPDILVTPHCAGPSEEGPLIEEFLDVFHKIQDGKTPERIVDFEKGY